MRPPPNKPPTLLAISMDIRVNGRLQVSHYRLGFSSRKHFKVCRIAQSNLPNSGRHSSVCDKTVRTVKSLSRSVLVPFVVILEAPPAVQLVIQEQPIKREPANQHWDFKPFPALNIAEQAGNLLISDT